MSIEGQQAEQEGECLYNVTYPVPLSITTAGLLVMADGLFNQLPRSDRERVQPSTGESRSIHAPYRGGCARSAPFSDLTTEASL